MSGAAGSELDERHLVAAHDLLVRPPAALDVADMAVAYGAVDDGMAAQKPVVKSRAARLADLQVAIRRRFSALAEEDADRGARFLAVPVLLGIGILIYHGMALEPGWQQVVLPVTVLAVLLVAARRRPVMATALAAMFCLALGNALAKLETWRASTPMLGSEVTTRLTGTVLHVEPSGKGRVRYVIRVEKTERPALRHAPAVVKVTAPGDWRETPPGMRLTGVMRLFPLSGPVRPGGYDFAREGYFDGIGATGFVFGRPSKAPDGGPERSVAGRLAVAMEAARHTMSSRIAAALGEDAGRAGPVVLALVTGVRGGVSDSDNESLRRSGLAHMLSISGLHMALVAGVVMAGMRLAFAAFPVWSDRHNGKALAAACALLAATAYLMISGGEIATLRSHIMLSVFLLAVLAGREALTLRNLAVAAIIALALFPHEIAAPGFQMSFAATAALIVGFRAWSGRSATPFRPNAARWHGQVARYVMAAIAGTAAASIMAGLATAPFAAYHFERVAPWSLAANLAAMPFISAWVMPAGVAAVLAMPMEMDGPIWRFMALGVEQVLRVSDMVAAWPGPDATGPMPKAAALLFAAALCIPVILQTRLRLAAVPMALAGMAILVMPRDPVIALISDDAALVALRWQEGAPMAVNVAKPQAFLRDNHLRTLKAESVALPELAETADLDSRDVSGDRSANRLQGAAETRFANFTCTDEYETCHAPLPDGRILLSTRDMMTAKSACGRAAIILLAIPVRDKPSCKGSIMITATDLALNGAVSISWNREDGSQRQTLPDDGPIANDQTTRPAKTWPGSLNTPAIDDAYRVTWAIGSPRRPWHADRIYSRAARGLPPYERQ